MKKGIFSIFYKANNLNCAINKIKSLYTLHGKIKANILNKFVHVPNTNFVIYSAKARIPTYKPLSISSTNKWVILKIPILLTLLLCSSCFI